MVRWLRSSLTLCALCTASTDTRASPLAELAGGADGLGSLQPRVIGGGASAAYFNPALLGDAPTGLGLAIVIIVQEMGVSLDGRLDARAAVPVGISNVARADGSPIGTIPLPTYELQAARPRQGAGTGHETFLYQSIGAVAKLFGERLSLGLHGMIPYGNFTTLTAFYNDEREQFFTNSLHPELYADRLASISLAGGLGWRFSERLSLGFGASLSLRAGVGASAYVSNVGELERLLINTDGDVDVLPSLNAGIAYQPFPRWRFTGTIHSPEEMRIAVDFGFNLPNGSRQGAGFPLVFSYMPWRVGIGARYDATQSDESTLTVVATALYGRWSDYRDRHGERAVPEYGWYDTLSPTLGVRYRLNGTSVGLDAQYKPTPVPHQTGRTNYVDNDSVGSGGVLEYSMILFGTPLKIGLQAHAHWLIPRHQSKLPTPPSPDGSNRAPALVIDELPDDSRLRGLPITESEGLQTNNPGWPGFGSRGVILTGGLNVTIVQ
jgi:long-chain fatty acid transport protein